MLPAAALATLLAAGPGAFERWQVESETTCAADPGHAFAAPDGWTVGSFRFAVHGARAVVRREGTLVASARADGPVARLGLLAAIKDFSPETKANLELFVAAFKKAGVDGIVVDGDSAYGVEDQDGTLTELFTWLGSHGVPVYAVIGNSESRSAFNRSLLAAFKVHPNVINLDLVRRVDAEGMTLLSLPGYYDRRYVHESAGCHYKPEDAQALLELARDAPAPTVLIAHGPPRQAGRLAIDATAEGLNVGDPELASVMQHARIRFGVFGHILESGGRATDLSGGRQVKPNSAATELLVNPGPAFADPWQLNGGGVSRGMAAILTLRGGKGEWQGLVPKARKTARP